MDAGTGLGYDTPCVLGVAGSPAAVGASLSPAMHAAAFASLGMELGYYIPLSLRESSAAKALRSLPRLGFRGANVTTPFKSVAATIAHSRSEHVECSGSANTLIIDAAGHIHAESTDGGAVVEAIEAAGLTLRAASAMLLGAGDVAGDIAIALIDRGVTTVGIWNRTPERIHALQQRVPILPLEVHADLPIDVPVDVLIGAVPEAAYQGASLTGIGPNTLVVDLAYRRDRQPTALCVAARAAGARVIDGREILARQGAASFALWLGVTAPYEVMSSAVT